MAGFIAGFDGDSPASIVDMAQRLEEIGIDVPFLSVLTPYKGTPLFDRLAAEDRMLPERGWQYYNGYNVAFEPQRMEPDELLARTGGSGRRPSRRRPSLDGSGARSCGCGRARCCWCWR